MADGGGGEAKAVGQTGLSHRPATGHVDHHSKLSILPASAWTWSCAWEDSLKQ